MSTTDIVALIPAAGRGSRLAPFPCPKELFPVGYQDYPVGGTSEKRPKVVSQYLVENMRKGNTAVNAEILQREGELGVVRPGALADLIVVDGDPLAEGEVVEMLQSMLAEESRALQARARRRAP